MHSIEKLREADPEVFAAIDGELQRQRDHIGLIASENFCSPAVMFATGSVLTNKYSEGYPGKRFYGGCEHCDTVETLAIERAKALFGAEHANVQPHAGAQANMAVYYAMIKPGDVIMGLNLSHGGHLTHGSPASVTGQYYKAVHYGVRPDTEMIDYDEMEKIAKEHRPKIIVTGASSYPRFIDFERIRDIADQVDALVMVDIAHIAGLIAGGAHPSPVPFADFVTTTTHKTLRGPRGGLILCKEKYAKAIDRAVFPGLQGGPLENTIAAKAICFKEALEPSFSEYQHLVVKNAKALAACLSDNGLRLVSGGTDNHLMLVDVSTLGKTGNEIEALLGQAHITANKNAIPFDKNPPGVASGMRFGTPGVSSRGMQPSDMTRIGNAISRIIKEGEAAVEEVKQDMIALCNEYPLYQDLL